MSFLKKIFSAKKEEKQIESYQDFWDWFLQHEKEFYNVVKKGGSNKIANNFFDIIAPKLNQLKEGIWYLTGMLNDSTADLILTSDGNIKNFYIIEELVKHCPNLPNWNFQAHKPSSKQTSLKMAGYEFTSENISFYSNDLEEYPDEIDLTVIHNDYTEENKQEIINGTYIFIDNYLGELNSITLIDNITFKEKVAAEKELIPIEKLESFLIWREKEFVEKYEGIRRDTENDTFSSLQAKLENGNTLVATINSDILKWDAKASHPWILRLEIKFDGEENNGFPDEETYQLLNEIEDEIGLELKDEDGYLNIGRETANSLREVYFACTEFRNPCKITDKFIKKYADKIEINHEIYKDKYWRSFERFQN